MVESRREPGGRRSTRGPDDDDWRALRRFSVIVWVSVAVGAWAMILATDAMLPGSVERLRWSGVFALVAGAVTQVLPRHLLLAGDLALRSAGIWVLLHNLERGLAPEYWLACLPMFLSAIVLPALFYRAIPMTVVAGTVAVATARLAAGSPVPTEIAVMSWVAFVWIMVLIVVVIQRLVAERRHSLDAMTQLAATDPLTGLANRRRFMEAARQMLVRAGRDGRPCTLVLLDLDHFKSVNDEHGHDAGDRVLVGVGDAMRASSAPADLSSRLGGEEFAVLMFGADVLHAQVVAAEIAAALRHLEPVSVTASFGVVEARPGDFDVGELLVRADMALYQAKRAGRNRCVVAS